MRQKVFEVDKEVEHITNWIKEYFLNNGSDTTKAVIGISGGKDSTIAAALLVRALGPSRVVGVRMPQGKQHDIDDAKQVCDLLKIPSFEINIANACADLYRAIDEGYDYDHMCSSNPGVATNTPARIRMTTLYAVAALVGGRVVNTCNWSENYVGYSTKYGDAAGDFSIFHDYTVREVMAIGDYLELPILLVHKVPSDGMCGSSDEDKLGFSYETLDAYLLDKIVPDYETYRKIETAHKNNRHKEAIHLPYPRAKTRHWDDIPYEDMEEWSF